MKLRIGLPTFVCVLALTLATLWIQGSRDAQLRIETLIRERGDLIARRDFRTLADEISSTASVLELIVLRGGTSLPLFRHRWPEGSIGGCFDALPKGASDPLRIRICGARDPITLTALAVAIALALVGASLSSRFGARWKDLRLLAARGDRLAHRQQQALHDLRTPLLLLKTVATRSTSHPGLLRDGVERLDQVLGDLADAPSRSSASNPSDWMGSLQRGITEARVFAESQGKIIDFQFEIPVELRRLSPPMPAAVLARILDNLLRNAVDACASRGRVEIRASRLGTTLARLEIRDEGRGIPADLLPRLDKRGFTFGKPGGTGLGLAYARDQWRHATGGSLVIASKPGLGTTIGLEWPLSLETRAEG